MVWTVSFIWRKSWIFFGLQRKYFTSLIDFKVSKSVATEIELLNEFNYLVWFIYLSTFSCSKHLNTFNAFRLAQFVSLESDKLLVETCLTIKSCHDIYRPILCIFDLKYFRLKLLWMSMVGVWAPDSAGLIIVSYRWVPDCQRVSSKLLLNVNFTVRNYTKNSAT